MYVIVLNNVNIQHENYQLLEQQQRQVDIRYLSVLHKAYRVLDLGLHVDHPTGMLTIPENRAAGNH